MARSVRRAVKAVMSISGGGWAEVVALGLVLGSTEGTACEVRVLV